MTRVTTRRWACVTAGEYDRATDSVVVNEAVVDTVAGALGVPDERVRGAILAHELAHATAGDLARDADEQRARAAALAAGGHDVVQAIDELLRATRNADRPGG